MTEELDLSLVSARLIESLCVTTITFTRINNTLQEKNKLQLSKSHTVGYCWYRSSDGGEMILKVAPYHDLGFDQDLSKPSFSKC